MNKEDQEEFFQRINESTQKNMNDLHGRFLTALEITEKNMLQAFSDETSRIDTRLDRLETRFDGLESRFDGLETRFDGLEKTVNFIKDFLLNNLVPRIEKLESGYQYLLQLVTQKKD